MPEENRFAGLSDAVDEDDVDDESDSQAEGVSDGDEGGSQSETTNAVELEHDDATLEEEPSDPTAFPFDATTKKTVYVRPETIDDLEDARALVDAQLRTQHDVRDLTGREFYDAAFRLAATDTDGLISALLAERDADE